MPLPRSVARFNKRYTNRFIEPLVRRSSGFAVVRHVGRTSGQAFTTPVNVFRDNSSDGGTPRVIVALTYGPSADWVRNVQSGPATLDLGAEGVRSIDSIELVGRDTAWPSLPGFVRVALRMLSVRDFASLTLL